jgi:hypothetical protein
MRSSLYWTIASVSVVSLGLAGCGNKGAELPKMDQTKPFVSGKDPEGKPAGAEGAGSKTGQTKWPTSPASPPK